MLGSERTIKVAIIGSGLAGLTAAYRLTTANLADKDVELEVHLFEKVWVFVSCHPANRPHIIFQSDSLGMDAHSINIPLSNRDPGGGFRVDVPMRSFLGGTMRAKQSAGWILTSHYRILSTFDKALQARRHRISPCELQLLVIQAFFRQWQGKARHIRPI